MRLLLDTHVFLWYISADGRLPAALRSAIQDPSNEVFLSVASVWETVIKYQIGKLPLATSPETFLPQQRDAHRIGSLSIDEAAMPPLASLPNLHRDPFDRLMIAQAIQHGLTFVTADPELLAYPVTTLSAV